MPQELQIINACIVLNIAILCIVVLPISISHKVFYHLPKQPAIKKADGYSNTPDYKLEKEVRKVNKGVPVDDNSIMTC